ncbi:aminotransferase class I/II-fold pyridoxal phosphate-dependent enzyme [Streptomyces niveus]|uniref:aminotransferase class I/II-fold pyridoxal phosphate-dependent enzyme n=1 Tax=Streptomyces niveus TaxID=193462 RepID=UPI0036543A1E
MTPTPLSTPRHQLQNDHLPEAEEVQLDLSLCSNPLGPPTSATAVLVDFHGRRRRELALPPHNAAALLQDAFAEDLSAGGRNVHPRSLVLGRGVSEFITMLARILHYDGRRVAVIVPEYTGTVTAFAFADFVGPVDTAHDSAELRLDRVRHAMQEYDYVILSNPSNPLGHYLDPDALLRICRKNPTAILVVDEEYIRFQPNGRSLAGADVNNLVVWQSAGKTYSIVGCRVGVMWTRHPILLARAKARVVDWPVSLLDASVALAALQDTAWRDASLKKVQAEAQALHELLTELGGTVSGGIHFRFLHLHDPNPLAAYLDSQGIRVRTFQGNQPGRAAGIRIMAPENLRQRQRLAEVLRARPQELSL